MTIPKFLLADTCEEHSEDIFIIHTEFPRFIINLKDDTLEFWEDIAEEDEKELSENIRKYIREATDFYDTIIKKYERE